MTVTSILLLSPPFRLMNWPSLALGCLKSPLTAAGIHVRALHMHLDVAHALGAERYRKLAAGWAVPQALASCLLAPAERPQLMAAARAELDAAPGECDEEYARWLTEHGEDALRDALTAVVDTQCRGEFDLFGVSAGALQLTAGLEVSRLLRARHPHVPIVFGGPSVLGEIGKRLLESFDAVDFVVDGEGETPLLSLCQLPDMRDPDALGSVPRLWYRRRDGSVARGGSTRGERLPELPLPDLSDFTRRARELEFPDAQRVLPIEGARGCAWEHRGSSGRLTGCSFCGIYRTAPDFRAHTLERVLRDIVHGIDENRCLNLSFVDAYLEPRTRHELLERIVALERDITLFCELRCDLDERSVELLAQAGARHVQLGVESFHSRILGRLSKGTCMLDNVASIKLCQEYGVPCQYNLMTHIPGVEPNEIEELIALLPSLFGLAPPSDDRFYLDRSSRMYQDPERYGIAAASLDARAPAHLPSFMARAGIYLDVPFELAATEADASVLDARWREVEARCAQWRETAARARSLGLASALTYLDGGSFLQIWDARGSNSKLIELEGVMRETLLACARPVRRDELLAALPGRSERELETCLGELSQLDLLLCETSRWLALPTRRLPSPRRARARAKPTTARARGGSLTLITD